MLTYFKNQFNNLSTISKLLCYNCTSMLLEATCFISARSLGFTDSTVITMIKPRKIDGW